MAWSLLLSRRSDGQRERFHPPPEPTADYGDQVGALWFDYVADVGDAFNPTMAIAWALGRQQVFVPEHSLGEWPKPEESGLPRGRFLVFGGDQVYPYASASRYANQLVGPYNLAWEGDDAPGSPTGHDVFALPGNHDWYGRPTSFAETFLCDGEVGRRRTRQKATWFALRLRSGWWLWAIDTGLRGSINVAQRTYFEQIAERLGTDDKIILCTPVPLWSLDAKHRGALDVVSGFVGEVVGGWRRVPLCLAGDSHVFAAWEQRIDGTVVTHLTSGGGGAFLHPTHHLATTRGETERRRFHLITCWPDADTSAGLSARWYQLLPDRQSRLLVALVAAAFAVFLRLVWGPFDAAAVLDRVNAAGYVSPVLTSPWTWVVGVVLAIGMMKAMKPNSRAPSLGRAARRIGLTLAVAELATVVVTGLVAGVVMANVGSAGLALIAGLVCALLGAVVSLVAFAALATVGNQRVSLADNLVFSAHHLEGFKHFLRFRIDDRGDLTVFAIGIEDVGHEWDRLLRGEGPPEHTQPRYLWGSRLRGALPAASPAPE